MFSSSSTIQTDSGRGSNGKIPSSYYFVATAGEDEAEAEAVVPDRGEEVGAAVAAACMHAQVAAAAAARRHFHSEGGFSSNSVVVFVVPLRNQKFSPIFSPKSILTTT